MTSCLLDCLRALWSFIMGSLRIILFFLCIIFLLVQTIIVASLLASYGVAATAYRPQLTMFIIANTVLFLLSLLGCYGAFYKHKPSIRLFAFLSGASAICFTICLVFMMNSASVKGESHEFEMRMKELMAKYDWTGSSTDPQAREATQFWDLFQSTACCGYRGPDDWAPYRPLLSGEVYPRSCCRSMAISRWYCEKPDIFSRGCEENLNSMIIAFGKIIVLYICFKFLLCIIASIVGTLNLSPTTQQQQVPTYLVCAPMNVRQAATNPYHLTSDRESKAPLVSSDHAALYNQHPPSYPSLAS